MRKIVLLYLILCGCVSLLHAQDTPPFPDVSQWAKDSIAPYQKYPTVPAFNIRLRDSVTVFNTYNIPAGEPIGIIFFDPDCKHCKHTLKNLFSNMDSVKDVQFYMITPVHDMSKLRGFYEEHHLADFKNIKIVGRDFEFFFFTYYRARSLPDIALYDEHKKLIKIIEGEFTASDIYKCVHP